MAEILVVDDERVIREGLKASLQGEGFDVRTARDGAEALEKIRERKPDLVLLDVMMPKKNGFCCCEEIRRHDPLLPVVFLTAKDSEADQIRGLGLGGDAYVSKASSDALLLACLNRVLLRAQKVCERQNENVVVRLGDISANVQTLAVTEEGREIAHLTRTEADILRILRDHHDETLVVDDIITELRGNGCSCEDGIVYTHICNLRRKLGRAGNLIVSNRSAGYRLASVEPNL